MVGLSSIFDLDTSLTVGGSSAYASYRQMAPHREVTGTKAFSLGPINFRFQTGSSVYVVPNRSYIRMRIKLGKKVGNGVEPLKWQDNIAPNINLGHHLFQNCEWRIGDKTVSRISDFVPQIGALHQRLNTSKNWRETTGRATNFANYSFTQRKADLTRDSRYLTGNSLVTPLYSLLDAALTALFEANVGVSVLFAQDVAGVQQNGTISFATATFANFGVAQALATLRFFQGRIGQIIEFGGGDEPVRQFIIKGEPVFTEPGGDDDLFLVIAVKRPAGDGWLAGTNLNDVNYALGPTTFGRSLQFIEYEQPDARGAGAFELCFQLPLSIWDYEKGIPGADHHLQLNPVPGDVLARAVIQSTGQSFSAADLSFDVVSMYLVTYQITGPPVTNTEFLIDLETIRLQGDNSVGTGVGNLTQKIFDVSPSTYALVVAYQDMRVGGLDTRLSSSQFRFFNEDLSYEGTNALNRFYIQYAGQQFPSPDADPSLRTSNSVSGTGNEDFTTERYMQTMIECGQFYQLAESIQEFRERGAFYYFLVPRDNTDKSTRVQVNQQFQDDDSNRAALQNALSSLRLCLFDLSRQVAVITLEGGNVTKVSLQDQ
jgi:hypothetical protein